MTTKYIPPPMKQPSVKVPSPMVPPTPKVPQIPETLTKSKTTITKFLPFICAGAAVGVSILALKELKKIKSEMVLVKHQQTTNQNKPATTVDPVVSKKMEQLEEQLKRVNLYLANKNAPRSNANGNKIIKNVLKVDVPDDIKILNDNPPPTPRVFPANGNIEIDIEDDEVIEYEEVEVTDDEGEEEDDE